MNSKTLKIIALLAMLYDHFTRIFPMNRLLTPAAVAVEDRYPEYGERITGILLDWVPYILSFTGRLAAPVFMFCIANGFFHTSNVKKYMLRLFGFAIVSQVPYIMFFQAEAKVSGVELSPFEVNLNILFTLGLGLVAIYCFERLKKIHVVPAVLAVAAIAWIAYRITAEGGYGYILIIFMFYLLKDRPAAWRAVIWVAVILLARWKLLQWLLEDPADISAQRTVLLNLIGAYLGILLTFFYNGKKGKIGKVLQYGVYWFYPVHLLLLGGIGFLIA